MNRTDDAMDGKVVEATKTFNFEAQTSRLLVSLRCVAKERDIKISVESYSTKATAQDELPGDAYAVSTEAETLGQPLGRVKFNGGEPIPLGSMPRRSRTAHNWWTGA